MTIRVEQFVGRWLSLEPQDQTRLASPDEPEGRNARLGAGAIAGARVWNVQSVIEIIAGPLTLPEFLSLLPGARWLGQIGDAVRMYVGLALDIRVRPQLAAASVPGTYLAASREVDRSRPPARLGWTTWLVTTTSTIDRSDAAFTVP
jgi:type VI secretion system protein ImpH